MHLTSFGLLVVTVVANLLPPFFAAATALLSTTDRSSTFFVKLLQEAHGTSNSITYFQTRLSPFLVPFPNRLMRVIFGRDIHPSGAGAKITV
jgi:hypothetical protein